jgi:hypothetical protein
MPLLELLGRTAAAAFLVAATFAAAHAVAARFYPVSRLALRWSAVVVVGMSLATLGFHVLGTFGVFTLPGALAGCAALLAVVLGPRAARAEWRRELARERVALRRALAALRRSPGRGWVAAFAVVSSTVVLRAWVLPPLGIDALVYHSSKAALWVHEGGLAFLHGINSNALFRNYPAGAEVFSAWGMLPYHSDFLAVAPESIQWLALILCAYAFTRELGVRDPYASIGAGLVAALPPARLLVGSGYIEPTIALLVAASMTFFVRFLRRGEPAALVLAAAALGVSAGTKVPTLILSVLAGAVLLARALVTRRARGLGAAVVVYLALGSPWYVYNVIDTGRPLSPLPIEVAGVELGRTHGTFDLFRTVRVERVKPYDWDSELKAFDMLFLRDATPHEAFGPPGLVVFAVFLLALPAAIRRRWYVFVPLALLVFANLAQVASPQFAQVRMVWPEQQARFLVGGFVILAPVTMTWCARFPRLGRVWAAGATFIVFRDLLRFVHAYTTVLDLHGQTVLALFLLAVWAALAVLGRGRRVVALGIAVVGVVWLFGWRLEHRYTLFRHATVIGVTPRSWVPMAQAVDHPTESYRLAITGNAYGKQAWYVFGFFGTRLQNEVFHVPVTRDGSLAHLMDMTRAGDREAWLARLLRRAPDFLVCVNVDTLECRWAKELREHFRPVPLERIAGGAVYRVVRRPEPTARRGASPR